MLLYSRAWGFKSQSLITMVVFSVTMLSLSYILRLMQDTFLNQKFLHLQDLFLEHLGSKEPEVLS